MNGAHSKNLFLKDKKNNFFLVSFIEDIIADLKKASVPLNSKKLSFANEGLFNEYSRYQTRISISIWIIER